MEGENTSSTYEKQRQSWALICLKFYCWEPSISGSFLGKSSGEVRELLKILSGRACEMFEDLLVLVFLHERLNCLAFKKLLCRVSAFSCTHLSIQTWGLSIDSKHFLFSSNFLSKTLYRSPFGIETFVIRFDMPYSIELLMPEALKYKRVIFPGSMLKKIFLHFPEVEQWNFHQISLKKNMSKILVQNVPVDNRYYQEFFYCSPNIRRYMICWQTPRGALR